LREIELGRPADEPARLARRMIVRELQISVWPRRRARLLAVFWIRRRKLAGRARRLDGAPLPEARRDVHQDRPDPQHASDLFPPVFLAPLVRVANRVPPFSGDAAKAAIIEEFGAPIEAIFAEFSPTPVASASVAQVHRAVLATPRGAMPAGAIVAVKIRRPGIVRRAYLDEAILRAGARLLSVVPTVGLVSPSSR